MKKSLLFLALIIAAMFFSGCTMTKDLAYFQNIDSINISQMKVVPQVRIKPNDELTIYVSSVTPEAAQPFNMNLGYGYSYGGSSSRSRSYTGGSYANAGSLYAYIVDKDGQINFPVLGKVKVLGLTRAEVEDTLAALIQPYFSKEEKPVVKCRISNFTITVIGEVGSTHQVSVSTDRMSIIEALASSGDLSIYGKRPNILLIREDATGEKKVARFNLKDARIFNSPYYFLEQNDIVYVEPNKAKARSAEINSYTFWTPISSLAISLATFVLSLTK